MNTDSMQIVASEQNQNIHSNSSKKGKFFFVGIILFNVLITFLMIRLFNCQNINLTTIPSAKPNEISDTNPNTNLNVNTSQNTNTTFNTNTSLNADKNINQNAIKITNTTEQIENKNTTQQIEFKHQNQFIPVYIWEGPIPQKYVQKMKGLKYPFRLIRNCDMLLNRMEQELDEKFSDFIYENINEKTDVCKYIHVYYEGGLYLDMDTDLDYECMKNFVKDQTLFFQMNDKTKGIDLFTIYSSKPRNPNIKWSLSFQNTFRSFSPYHTTLFTQRLDRSEYNVSKSNCIKHYSDRSWVKK